MGGRHCYIPVCFSKAKGYVTLTSFFVGLEQLSRLLVHTDRHSHHNDKTACTVNTTVNLKGLILTIRVLKQYTTNKTYSNIYTSNHTHHAQYFYTTSEYSIGLKRNLDTAGTPSCTWLLRISEGVGGWGIGGV